MTNAPQGAFFYVQQSVKHKPSGSNHTNRLGEKRLIGGVAILACFEAKQ